MCPERANIIIYDDEQVWIDKAVPVLTKAGHIVIGTAISFDELSETCQKCVTTNNVPDVVLLDDYSNYFDRPSGTMAELITRKILGLKPVTVAFTSFITGKYGQYGFEKTFKTIEQIGEFVNSLPGKNPDTT
jgi:hypothetical protein